jgi:predicted dehydrogenase
MTIRVGAIGLRFGGQVHVPAFRSDPRCEVVALAGRDPAKAAAAARELSVPAAFDDWRDLVKAPEIDAVSIAVPPAAQPAIIAEAARHGKHVFCEKPLAASTLEAQAAFDAVRNAGVVHGIDFTFPEIAAWRHARSLIADGALGQVAHFAYTWRVETYASRTNAETWKNRPGEGGGVLGNFVSHVLYNIEWLLGRIGGFDGLVSPPGRRSGRAVDGVVRLETGARGSLSVSSDAFLGSGHLVEVYGDEGTLVLTNPTADYAAGFRVQLGTRASGRMACVFENEGGAPQVDGRLGPVSVLVRRFLDAIERGAPMATMTPNLADGLRVQELLALADAAQDSAGRDARNRGALAL